MTLESYNGMMRYIVLALKCYKHHSLSNKLHFAVNLHELTCMNGTHDIHMYVHQAHVASR